MSRDKNGKKGNRTTSRRLIYKELASIESQTPEEMLNKLGGVSAHAGQDLTKFSPPGVMTADSVHVTGTLNASLPELGHLHAHAEQETSHEPETSHMSTGVPESGLSGHLEQNHGLGSPEHDSHDPGGHSIPAPEPNWQQEATQAEQAAQTYQSEGHYKEAGTEYMQAGNDLMHVNCHSAADAYINAANSYSCAVNLHGDQSAAIFNAIGGAYSHAGDAYGGAGEYTKAAEAYNNAAANYASIINVAHGPADAYVQIADAYMNSAGAYMQAGNYNEAVTQSSNAATNFVHVGANLGAGQAFLLEAEANVKGGYGWQTPVNFQNAAHYFALGGDPQDAASAYAHAATYYNNEGGHQSDVAHCARLAGENYLQLAQENQNADDFSKAKDNFKLAVKNYSSSDISQLADCYEGLGHVYMKEADYTQAASAFENAAANFSRVVLNEQNPSAQQWQDVANAYSNAGQAYEDGKHYNQAAEAYKNAAVNYQHVNASEANSSWTKSGQAYHEAAGNEQAEGNYRQAAAALLNACNVYGNAGNWTESISMSKDAGRDYIMAAEKQDLGNSDMSQADLSRALSAYRHAADLASQHGGDARSVWAETYGIFSRACTFFANQGEMSRSALANDYATYAKGKASGGGDGLA